MKYLIKAMPAESQNEGFVMLPRKIKTDFLNGKLTKSEMDVLIWIWLGTNPVNGLFQASYDGLVQDFRGRISNDSARSNTYTFLITRAEAAHLQLIQLILSSKTAQAKI